MEEIVDQDEPIVKTCMPLDEAKALFQERGYDDKVRLLKYRRQDHVVIYILLDEKDYFYGYMVPSAGYLRYFKLVSHPLGFILCCPRRGSPTRLPYETLDALAEVGQRQAVTEKAIRFILFVVITLGGGVQHTDLEPVPDE